MITSVHLIVPQPGNEKTSGEEATNKLCRAVKYQKYVTLKAFSNVVSLRGT